LFSELHLGKSVKSDTAALKSLYTGDMMHCTSMDSLVSGFYLGDIT
jgi:hypothetical protein